MEKKKIDLYTEEEKEALLVHWWQNYGRVNVNLTEADEFLGLVKKDSSLVFEIALVSSLLGKTTEPLVHAMRTNTLSDFIESVNTVVASGKYQNMREKLEMDLLNKLVQSYNLRATICLSYDQEQLAQLLDAPIAKEPIPLTDMKVANLYNKCVLKRDEFLSGSDFAIGYSETISVLFHISRLEEERESITALIDQVVGVDEGTFFPQMRFDREGKCWTIDSHVVSKLVELGNALGVLDINFREDRNGNPSLYVSRNKEKDIPRVFNKKPDECKKDV